MYTYNLLEVKRGVHSNPLEPPLPYGPVSYPETQLKSYQMHPEYQLECCFHPDECGELCCCV